MRPLRRFGPTWLEFSAFFVLSNLPQVVRTLGPTWCEASAKLCNVVGPGRPRASHGLNLAAIGIDLWARFQPNMTNWLQIAQLGPMLGPSWPKLGPFGAARGPKLGPTRANFQTQCEAMLPTLGLAWAQNLRPNVLCCAVLGPSWSQLGRNEFGAQGQGRPSSFGWAK